LPRLQLLEEHRRRYEAGETTFNFAAMCKALTVWRDYAASLAALNAQSLQVTAKRAALAFEAFFRRVTKGETPGYPRFKARERFSGFGYKAHGDGWKLMQAHSKLKRSGGCAGHEYGAVRLSGIGTVSMRGCAGFDGVPKTAELLRKANKWYLSVTFDVTDEAIRRDGGRESMAFDWGLTTLLTQVVGDALTGPIETVDNPRWLKKQLMKIKEVQQATSRLETAAKLASGKEKNFPVNARLFQMYRRLRALHGKVARQRHDFYHKLTTALFERFGLIVTEELSVANMSRAPKPKKSEDGTYAPNGAAAKAGLNRSILDAAPAGFIAKLRYKAADACSKFMTIPPRKVKPSQRCCYCGRTEKHDLSVRAWTCKCGGVHHRDENAARTTLRYAYEGDWWKLKDGAGTVPAAAALRPV
jgi:putative transposase